MLVDVVKAFKDTSTGLVNVFARCSNYWEGCGPEQTSGELEANAARGWGYKEPWLGHGASMLGQGSGLWSSRSRPIEGANLSGRHYNINMTGVCCTLWRVDQGDLVYFRACCILQALDPALVFYILLDQGWFSLGGPRVKYLPYCCTVRDLAALALALKEMHARLLRRVES